MNRPDVATSERRCFNALNNPQGVCRAFHRTGICPRGAACPHKRPSDQAGKLRRDTKSKGKHKRGQKGQAKGRNSRGSSRSSSSASRRSPSPSGSSESPNRPGGKKPCLSHMKGTCTKGSACPMKNPSDGRYLALGKCARGKDCGFKA